MTIPTLTGIIRRRVLLNYRVSPDVVEPILPANFRPKLVKGFAVAGICLIRLEQIRPKDLPGLRGIASENTAHRIAVEWEDDSGRREGVFIPRRHTNSRLNALAGGRLFPGFISYPNSRSPIRAGGSRSGSPKAAQKSRSLSSMHPKRSPFPPIPSSPPWKSLPRFSRRDASAIPLARSQLSSMGCCLKPTSGTSPRSASMLFIRPTSMTGRFFHQELLSSIMHY